MKRSSTRTGSAWYGSSRKPGTGRCRSSRESRERGPRATGTASTGPYDREGIGYRGPAMGWWEVPDQFTLYALHQQEIRTATRPRFAKVSLIMSHIPYWPVPPYVTPWSRFDAGTAYEGPLRSVAHDDTRDLAELSERYVTALEYQFRILGGFLRGFAPPPGAGRRDRGPPAAEALAARQRHLGNPHPSLFPGPGTPWSLGSTRVHPHARARCGHLMANERFSPRPLGALSRPGACHGRGALICWYR